jgi:hypothetical protein
MKEKFKRGGKNQKSGRKTKEREEELNKSSSLCHERRRGCELKVPTVKEYIVFSFLFSQN